MLRLLTTVFLLLSPAAVLAQPGDPDHHQHQPMSQNKMPMGHMPMDHARMMAGNASAPTQPGQAAFAAIQEIVQILETDPRTDWSKVDVEALRQHLIDMNNVTLAAQVRSEPIEGGLRFVVTGDGAIRDSIRRMTSAHAATMDGAGGWHYLAHDADGGASFEVRVPPQDIKKLKGLGFTGVMTRGMHHQEHHLMIARGGHPHH